MSREKGFAASDMLTSKEEIMTAFGLSDWMFWEYINQGMPALYLNKRWSASITSIQIWWQNTRNVSMRNMLNEIRKEQSVASQESYPP